jgi:dUTP pyrophosphatase
MIRVKKLDPKAIVPAYHSKWASGFDLHSLTDNMVRPGEIRVIHTGISLQIPWGCEVQIRQRSGISKEFPNYIANSPGTIDADYRGEIMVMVVNNRSHRMWIRKGERIAQAVLARVERCGIVEAQELCPTDRGAGGFGSTGTGVNDGQE